MRTLRFLVLAVLIPLSAFVRRGSAQSPGASTAGAPRVQTAHGAVQGVALPSGVRAFRGIPFAAAPVRELRWKPPQPVQSWTGVRPSDRFAAQCMQARVFGDMMFRNAGMSEDCLYLNVWAPAASRPNAGLPVLVYFYGGGFVAGDGSEPRYDGESMAKHGILVVTLSYRLGVFGFFSHPELTAESPNHASGNYGLMDQTAALRWVRENIAAFGGDPQQVTIAGESAGSSSVSSQMASPLARGLFARGIGESGAMMGRYVSPRDTTQQNGVRFAESLGAKSLTDLRALSATELLEAASRPSTPRFGANVDGWFFPRAPTEIYAAGEQSRVPLLAGWNSEEMSSRALLRDEPTLEAVRAVYAQVFGARAAEAEQFFPLRSVDEMTQSLTDIASDRFIAFNTWKWIDEHARTSGQPVYRYFYAHPRPRTVEADVTPNLAGGVTRGGTTSPPPAARGAVHSAEIEYALGNLQLNKVFAWTADDYKVSETLQGYFENFIKTGNPNGQGLPSWPTGAVDAGGGAQRMRIDVQARAEPDLRARYLFLDEVFSSGRW